MIATQIRSDAEVSALPRQTSHLPALAIPLTRRHVPGTRPDTSKIRFVEADQYDGLYGSTMGGVE